MAGESEGVRDGAAAAGQPWGRDDSTIGALLARSAREDGARIYCRAGDRAVTVAELDRMADRIANGLAAAGIRSGDRVAVMLNTSVENMALFFALARLGALHVPVNVHLRGEGLVYLLANADCACAIVEEALRDAAAPALAAAGIGTVYWNGAPEGAEGLNLTRLTGHGDDRPFPSAVAPDDVIYISYTSGTTGMPKGVLLTDRMLRVAAHAAARAGGVGDGDIFHMWEPLYHIGGCEVLIVAVQHRITLGLVPKFSVSRFWDEVRALGATHIHFLGGVLALLLKEPPGPRDRDHGVRVAWGGGCPEPVWRAFQERFGVAIRECYGLTECASFATLNLTGKIGSVGRPLPHFEITLVDDDGKPAGPGQRGEIWIRERVPGILTPGYWRNPEATAAVLVDGVLRTGDLAVADAEGDLVYLGRKKDSLRRRGENIAAFEVERILNQHPDVEESAVVGVVNDLQDEDIKAFLRLRPGAALDPLDLIRWCEGRMAYFQIPRFVAFIDAFPKTPSLRIRKELLSRDADGCWDLAKTDHVIRR